MHRRFISVLRLCLFVMLLAVSVFQPQTSAVAAPALTITPLTWNIIGLDSNTPASGPYLFPVGARVCAGGATTVTVKFNWEDGKNAYNGDPYINLRSFPFNSASSMTLTFTAAGCQDAYFEVQVTKVAAAYDKTRRYYITAENAGGADLVSTPRPRELYVEHLISQNRNSVTDVKLNDVSIPAGGTMNLIVGNTYTIDLVGGTATQGYNQFESFINFPNTIFQIISKTANTPNGVLTDYAANNSPYISGGTQPVIDYQGLYADACKWENDPTNPNYRSCVGGDGKTGGAPVTTTYTIKVIGGAGTTQTLNSLLYDFSGSSFHYNSDAGIGVRFAQILGPSSVTMQKSFSPKAISPAGTSTMTIKLSNPTTENITGVHFTDTFPTSPAAMTVASPLTSNNACGGTLQDNLGGALSAGDAGIRLINGTINANTTCTITVNVTVPSSGTYDNTTGNLFISLSGTDTNTGNNASDILTAASAAACTTNQTLVTWAIPVGATNPPDSAGSPTTNNTGFTATASAQTLANTSVANIGTNDAASWLLYGLQTGNYFQFVVDTRNYSGVTMTFQLKNASIANGPTAATVSYNNGTGFTSLPASTLPIPIDTNWTPETINFSGLTSTTGATTFRIAASGAKNDNNGAGLNFDVISFSGCALAAPAPTIAKSFRNSAGTADVTSIQKGGTSILRFTVSNTAAGNKALTGMSFTDALPLGLDVTSGTSSQCSGTLTATNNTSPTLDTISLSGGSLPAGGSCTFDVNVTGTTAGQYDNVTGYISSTESGTSTNYAEDTLDVIAPPVLAKSFNLSSIFTNATSMLSFTITNPNNFSSLTGIGFTDTLPGGVTALNGTTNDVCGTGSSLVISGGNLLTLSGASLAANGSCTYPVTVTGATAGTKNNTTTAVTSTEAGNGNTASATLEVKNPTALIGLNKQVSTDNATWLKYVGFIVPQDIWYKLTVTNDGEVSLDGINLSDSGVDLTNCAPALPATLAVGASATCVLGPISVSSAPTPNPFTNTATVTTTTYTPTIPVTSSAKYGTESLAIVKNVTETYFIAKNDTLHYNYIVTNNGGYPILGPVTVSDSKIGAVSCQDTTAVGDNDLYLDPGEAVYCPGPTAADTVSYSVSDTDVFNKLVTNIAHGSASGVNSPDVSKTVPLAPNLSVTKINSITGNTTSGSIILGSGTFDWTLTVSNSASAGPASFANGETILTDTLPIAGATYSLGTVTYSGGTAGTVNCSFDNATFVLTCAANGSVNIPTGASFSVPITVTPSAVGSLINPKTGGSCQVDPSALLVEVDETNNNCNSNTVMVLAPPVLTLQKSVVNDNGGTALDTAWTLSATQAATTISGVEGNPAITNATVAVGTWTLSESGGPSGYTPGIWSCSGTSDNDPNDGLTLVTGETVTCTITNNDNAPSLTLQKTVINDNGGSATASDWTLTATGASATPTNLSGATPVTSGTTFKADTYTLGETGVPTGYNGTWACTNGVTVTGGQITLGLGQSTTCTITNDDIAPSLTLVKTVTNDNAGTAVASDWTLTATGASGTPTNLSGTTPVTSGPGFKADTYTLAETGGPTGYTASAWSCTNGVPVAAGLIKLDVGQSTTCTINNNDNNQLPLAVADTNNATEGGAAVTGDVRTNDTLGDVPTPVTSADQAGNTITFGTPFATAAGGTLILNANGTYSYTPPATLPEGGALIEVFNYTITDVDGDTSSSTLTITINRLPQANADTNASVGSGPAVTGNTITNDDEGNTNATVTAADQSGAVITIGTAFTTAGGGALTLNLDGSYSYTPPAAGSVPPGGLTEVFNYTITDANGDISTSTLTITVTVTPAIDAVNDNDSTPANTPVTTIVTTNDTTANGTIDPNSVTVTTPPSTGTVLCTGTSCEYTPPAGFVGAVTYTYQVCLAAPNGSICDSAIVTLDVTPTIDAVDDDYSASAVNGVNGGTTASVIDNDTTNGVAAAIGTNVTLTAGTAPTPTSGSITMNPDGTITVAPGTTAGTYTYQYTICTNSATTPDTCDTAMATVALTAAPILAVDDNAGPINGLTGATNVLNVFSNDTLNSVAVNPADVTLTRQPAGDPELTLNPNGTVDVAPGTPAGSYSFDYQICENLNPTNCSTATVTVTVATPVIDAVNDIGSTVNGAIGGQSLANVLTNDSLNSTSPVLLADVNLTQISTTNSGITLNPLDGSVNVAVGTLSGNYVITYQICEKVNPTVCDTATVTVPVNAPNLELAKTNNATSVTAGDTTTYELTVLNSGLASTSGTITVMDVLPADMNIADGSVTLGGVNAADWTCNALSNVITCTSNTVLAANTTSVFSFTVNVSATAGGTQVNKARLGGGGDPMNPNPPTSVTVGQCSSAGRPQGCATDIDGTGVALVADPALSKSVNPLQASVGETVTFTLTVTNNGTAPAPGVVVTDALPSIFDVTAVNVTGAPGAPGTTVVNITPAIGTGPAPYTVVVTLGADLDVTDVVTIQIVTKVNAQGNPPINNRASLTTSGSNSSLTNDVASVAINVRQPRTTSVLPATGFPKDIETKLAAQPSNFKYSTTNLMLEIPSLGVKIPIVGVPKKDGTWNISWLANQAGWLEGSAFPSWNGNSVLTGHVYGASGLPGPFVNLYKMKFGDKIIVHAYGQKYTFELQTNQLVKPDDTSVMKHEEKPWLTLVTCKDYDEKTKTYKNRVVVRAVLVQVDWDK